MDGYGESNFYFEVLLFFFLDSADVLARELVEADLLDGCDSLIGKHGTFPHSTFTPLFQKS